MNRRKSHPSVGVRVEIERYATPIDRRQAATDSTQSAHVPYFQRATHRPKFLAMAILLAVDGVFKFKNWATHLLGGG